MKGGTLAGAARAIRQAVRVRAPASGNRLLSSEFIGTPVGRGLAARAIGGGACAAARTPDGARTDCARSGAARGTSVHGAARAVACCSKKSAGIWPVRPEGRRILLPGMRQKTRL